MDFKIDENLPVEVADVLHQAGYDAVRVVEQHLGGAPDFDFWRFVVISSAVLW